MSGGKYNTDFWKYRDFKNGKPDWLVLRTSKIHKVAVIVYLIVIALVATTLLITGENLYAVLDKHYIFYGIIVPLFVIGSHSGGGDKKTSGHYVYMVGHGWGYTLW